MTESKDKTSPGETEAENGRVRVSEAEGWISRTQNRACHITRHSTHFCSIHERVRRQVVENLKKQVERGRRETGNLGQRLGWEAVLTINCMVWSWGKKRVREASSSPAEDFSSPTWEAPERMGRVSCWSSFLCPLPARPDWQRWTGRPKGRGRPSGSGPCTGLQAGRLG